MPSAPLKNEIEKYVNEFMVMIHTAAIPEAITSKLHDSEDTSARKANSSIFIRIRPILEGEPDAAPVPRKVPGKRECVFLSPKISVSGAKSLLHDVFDVDATFDASDGNEVVYNTTCQPLVELALAGGSACILAYGQTGSGKTHTVGGMLPLVARDLGKLLGQVELTVTAVELCGDEVTDLIGGNPVNVVEDTFGKVQMLGAEKVPAETTDDVLRFISKAVSARSSRTTARNKQSSRSHMIIKLVLTRRDSATARPGVLILADLAGSESTADSATHDKERLNETRAINTSLMTLKECIRARGEVSKQTNKHVHIPFRNSKLTLIMKDAFELVVQRPTKTVIIACVSPLLQDFRHSANTLKYAGLLFVSLPSVILEVDRDDPQWWTREQCEEFFTSAFKGRVTLKDVLPEGDGRLLVEIPEAEFIRRVCAADSGLGEKLVKVKYTSLWKLVIDARTKRQSRIASSKENVGAPASGKPPAAGAAAGKQMVRKRSVGR